MICILFVVILLAKWMILLNFSVCSVNYSSMRSTRSVSTLSSPILWKADAKLPKQQLLDYFWCYFRTGLLDETVFHMLFFHYQMVLQIIDMIFIIMSSISLIKFSIEIWFTCHEIVFLPLMIKMKPMSWYWGFPLEVIFLGIWLFLFILWILSADNHHMCI